MKITSAALSSTQAVSGLLMVGAGINGCADNPPQVANKMSEAHHIAPRMREALWVRCMLSLQKLECITADLPSTNTNGLVETDDKNFAVAHFSGSCSVNDGVDRHIKTVLRDCALDFQFG